MKVSISQPTLFSWLGYYNIIKNYDTFVFFDNVKFEKRSWQSRNKIKNIVNGDEHAIWITIPTKHCDQNTLIKDVLIDNSQNWKDKHLQMFQSHYGNDYKKISFISKMYEREWEKLSDFTIEFTKRCCEFLEIKTKILKSSDMDVCGKKSHLLLDICKKLNATEYFSSIGAKDYLESDKNIFFDIGINIRYHDYVHPIYSQRGKKFLPHLSIIDLLFNEKNSAKNFI